MKISKFFNENVYVAKPFYYGFKFYHLIKKAIYGNEKYELLGDKPVKLYVPYHPIPENNLFGHVEVFKKYINYKSDLSNVHIQHGVILGKLVQKIMIDSFATKVITYSTKRQKIIEGETGKNIIAVGPYIKYAEKRLSDESFAALKNKLGKTLLVFPAHSSVDRTKIDFDQIALVEKINEIRDKYGINTVLINLFYSDCTKESINLYESYGFQVCSAGYWLSENFLPNLRTIIELSDLTMSNRVGTHVGYCVALNRPHYIYKQNYREDFIGKKGLEDLEQTNKNSSLEEIDTTVIENAFSTDDFVISADQKRIVNEYWGNDIFYTPEELYHLILKI